MKGILQELIDFIKGHTERFKFIFFVFILLYLIVDYKFWLHDLEFWSINEPGETPEPPAFLDDFFGEIVLATGLVSVLFFSISKYLKRFENTFINYLKSFFNLLGFLAITPLCLFLLIVILYAVVIGAKLLIMFGLTLVVSYFSARGVELLWEWLES